MLNRNPTSEKRRDGPAESCVHQTWILFLSFVRRQTLQPPPQQRGGDPSGTPASAMTRLCTGHVHCIAQKDNPKLALRIFSASNAVGRLRSRRGRLTTRSETITSGRANCDAATATTWEEQSVPHPCASTPGFFFFGHWMSVWPASKDLLFKKHQATRSLPTRAACERRRGNDFLSGEHQHAKRSLFRITDQNFMEEN